MPRLINRVPLASPSAGGGVYPPFLCLPGYVFREAVPTDYIGVTPQERDETAAENEPEEIEKQRHVASRL